MEEEIQVRPGDIVVLKSGGPRMTAGSYLNAVVNCYWFDTDKVFHQQQIHFKALEKAK